MSPEAKGKRPRRSSVGLRLIIALLAVFGVYLLSTTIVVYALLEQYSGFKDLSERNFGRAMTAAELARDAEGMATEAFEEMLGVNRSYSGDKPANSDLVEIFQTARAALDGEADQSLREADQWQKPYLDSLTQLRQMLADERERKAGQLGDLGDLLKLGDEVEAIQSAAPPTNGAVARFAASAWATLGYASAALTSEQAGQIQSLREKAETELARIAPAAGASGPMADTVTEMDQTVRRIFDARLPGLQAQRAELATARQARVLAQKLTAATVNYYLDLKRTAQAATQRHEEIARATILAIVVFLLIAVAITVFVVLYIARSVVRRLNDLNHAMSAHVAGDPVRIPATGDDEIAAMGHAFEVFVTARDTAEHALEAAREEAEQANRAKGEFLANVSHEIRTPLNGIIGFATLIRPTKLARTQAEYVEKILRSAEHLSRVIDDILDFSKIEAGRFDLDVSAFELDEVLRTVSDILVGSANSKGIVFEIVEPEGLRRALIGDRLRLVQVLVNLVGNAIKFTERGGVVLAVSVGEDRGDAVELRFLVRDTGIGMTEPQVRNLFGKFHQADTSITRRFGGTGLGLAISKHLVELMGGEISVTSEPGIGSTFTFALRFECGAEPAALEQLPSLADGAEGPASSDIEEMVVVPAEEWRELRGRRVLLVDDQPLNREIASVFLKQQGVLVEVATGGREAVDRAIGSQPGYFDAVLMDVQMPDVDGFQATRLIRKTYSAAELPIIAMTAHSLDEQRIACLEAGMNDHVAKPIEVKRLWGTLLQWMKPRSEVPPAIVEPEAIESEPVPASGLPMRLAGFDLAAGIANAGGDPVLFRRLLLDFPKWARITEAQIRDALARSPLANRDLRDAELGAHSLVGMAASVSAIRLTAAARALERTLSRDETKGLDELFREVQLALDEVCGSLGRIEAAADEVEPADVPDIAAEDFPWPDQRSALTAILHLLESQDFDAEARFHEYLRHMNGAVPSQELQAIGRSIEQLDFRRAAFAMRSVIDAMDEGTGG